MLGLVGAWLPSAAMRFRHRVQGFGKPLAESCRLRALCRMYDPDVVMMAIAVALFGLWFSPADVVQGESVRILYVHVPTAWLAYVAFVTTAAVSGSASSVTSLNLTRMPRAVPTNKTSRSGSRPRANR